MRLTTHPVRSRDDRRAFVRLPHRLYARDPLWVAPIWSDLRARLDLDRAPFFAHGRAELFLARRGGEPVGRISAHVDDAYTRLHSKPAHPDRAGFFGFFECDDDGAAAEALIDAAAEWLADRGCDRMIGPASFTLNDEAGLLIDGFDRPPMFLMAYNPPYYEPLLEKSGLAGVQDLFAYRLDASSDPPPDVERFARTAEAEFTFRTIDLRRFDEEMRRFLEVYNAAWEANWGFAPFSESEIREHAKRLRPIVDPNLVFVVECGSEPVAVGLTLPDLNEALISVHGRLGPVAAARVLWRARRRRWSACRVVALGVKKEFRRTGIGAHLYIDTLSAAAAAATAGAR
ncbi:MAG TPA: N-acetyltransferase [Actinomycetota bacterium]|nr:N-acetyltransferase [Actinomycetota bacterium]